MKKLLLFTLLAIIGCLLISCNASIMKRHYRNGFFVEHKKHSIPRIANTTIQAAQRAAVEKEATREINSATLESTLSVKESTPEPKKPTASAVSHKNNRLSVGHHKLQDFASIPKMRRTIRATAEKIVEPEAGLIGAALSLFWIVILVILVIYLAGLVFNDFGLGNFIHILAIIVLVLLVLWLLRIV